MVWQIRFDARADKEFLRLDAVVQRRILLFFAERALHNPFDHATALVGKRFQGLYRFRIGDYRVIATIDSEAQSVLVCQVGHRREVYD